MPNKTEIDVSIPEQSQKELDRIKQMLIGAGYGRELSRYNGNTWFKAACDAGLLRDGDGNAVRPGENVSVQEAIARLTNIKGEFYIPEKDTGHFRKYRENGSGDFESAPYNTPPRIEVPSVFLRFLDYCGFNIPSVKSYRQQLQSVKGNPLYYKLHTEKGRQLSERFILNTSRVKDIVPDEPEAEIKPEIQPEVQPEIQPEIQPEEQPEAIEQETAQNIQPENNIPLAVSVEEEDGVIKITMDDGSVQIFNKKAPEAEAQTAVQNEEAEKVTVNIDEKLTELTQKEKLYPESSPMGLALLEAKQALSALSQTGLPENPSAQEYGSQFDTAEKTAAALLLVDQMEYMLRNGTQQEKESISLGREDSPELYASLKAAISAEAVKQALNEKPAQALKGIIEDPDALFSLGTDVSDRMLRQTEMDANDIQLKYNALLEKEKAYPESSAMGLAILEAKENLRELSQTGLAEDIHSPGFALLQRTAASLVLIEELEKVAAEGTPEQKEAVMFGRENSADLRDKIKNQIDNGAIHEILSDRPALRMRSIIGSQKNMNAFMEDIDRVSVRLAEEKSAPDYGIPEEEKDAFFVDRKIAELAAKAESYPENSAMGLAIKETQENLALLAGKSFTENPFSAEYDRQFDAMQKAAAGLMLIDQMEYIVREGSEEAKQSVISEKEDAQQIKNHLKGSVSAEALRQTLQGRTADKFRSIISQPDGVLHFSTAVSERMTRVAESDFAAIGNLKASLERMEQDYPESSAMGLAIVNAKESLDAYKETWLPDNPESPEYESQLDHLTDTVINLMVVSELQEKLANGTYAETESIRFGRENSAALRNSIKEGINPDAVKQLLSDVPAEQFRHIISESEAFEYFKESVKGKSQALKEKEEEELKKAEAADKEKEAPAEEKKEEEPEKEPVKEESGVSRDTYEIDKKIAELNDREKNYPASSPMGLAITQAKESLSVLKETGLPENSAAPEYQQQFSAMQKAAAGLLLIDQMDYIIRTQPYEQKSALFLGRENSAEIKQGLEKLSGTKAVEKALSVNPADKFRRLLNDPKVMRKFDLAIAKEMKKNPVGNVVPEGSVVFGAIYRQPGKKGWSRFPGASEQEVSESINKLAKLSPDDKMLEKVLKPQQPHNADHEAQELEKRIRELKADAAAYPASSVMGVLNARAAEALGKLRETGLPADPADPAYGKQNRALKDAVCCLCAYQHASRKMQTLALDKEESNPEVSADKLLSLYEKNRLLDSMMKTDAQTLCDKITDRPVNSRSLLDTVRKEQQSRKENGIPETAERKGVLYRMNPNEKWKQVPGATLKEVNDSMLTVLDEGNIRAEVSTQKSMENIHLSDASLLNPSLA